MGAKSGTLTLTLLILHPGQNKTRSVLKWLKSAKSSGSHLIAWEVIDWSTVSHRLSLSFPRHYYNARPIISYLNRIWFLKVHLPRKAVCLPMLVPFLGLSSRSPWTILNQFDFQCGSLAIFRQAVPKQEWRILELPFLKDPAHVFDFACGPLDLWLLFSHEFWQVWTLDRFGGAFLSLDYGSSFVLEADVKIQDLHSHLPTFAQDLHGRCSKCFPVHQMRLIWRVWEIHKRYRSKTLVRIF